MYIEEEVGEWSKNRKKDRVMEFEGGKIWSEKDEMRKRRRLRGRNDKGEA